MKLTIDPDKLKIKDIVFFEEFVGQPITALADIDEAHPPSGKVMAALVFIAARKDNPAFTIEDALELEMGDIEMGDDETVPPTVDAS